MFKKLPGSPRKLSQEAFKKVSGSSQATLTKIPGRSHRKLSGSSQASFRKISQKAPKKLSDNSQEAITGSLKEAFRDFPGIPNSPHKKLPGKFHKKLSGSSHKKLLREAPRQPSGKPQEAFQRWKEPWRI